MSHPFFHKISKTFCFAEKPETSRTAEGATLKYSTSTLAIAAFALPFLGGSLTATTKFISSIFLINSFLALGLALTKIFILS